MLKDQDPSDWGFAQGCTPDGKDGYVDLYDMITDEITYPDDTLVTDYEGKRRTLRSLRKKE